MERFKHSSLLKLPTICPYGTLGYKIIKYKMMFCVPAERIVGRKMIRIEKRSVGTHGVMFPKLMIIRFARNVPMERFKYSSLLKLPTICPYGTLKKDQ